MPSNFPDILEYDSPFEDSTIFGEPFDNKQQASRYIRDILQLMKRHGIPEFYYTHLASDNSNVGIFFHGKIIKHELSVNLITSVTKIVDEKYINQDIETITKFSIVGQSQGNLLLKGKDNKWSLIVTGNFYESLPFKYDDYVQRISNKNYDVKFLELKQIYEEMRAKENRFPKVAAYSLVPQLAGVVKQQLANKFYQTVKLCVDIKELDAAGNKIGEDFLRTDPKAKVCEVKLNITIRPGNVVEIRHVMAKTYLAEFENKWKKEAKARGVEVDVEGLRKQFIKDFESLETENNFYETLIQKSKALFNDKIGGYVEAIQATQKVAKNIWEEGAINESTWYTKNSENRQWPSYMQLNSYVGGVVDGVVDEIVGIPMACKATYEIATSEEKRDALSAVFTSEGMAQLYEGLKKEAEAVTGGDSDKTGHFAGKTTISVASMLIGTGFITKAKGLQDGLTSATKEIHEITNPKVLNILDGIRKNDLHKPEILKSIKNLLESINPKILDKFADAPGFDKAIKEMSQQWTKFNGGKFVLEYASGKVGKGNIVKFEVQTIGDINRRYDIEYDELLPDGSWARSQKLELKNWTGFYKGSIQSQLPKDLALMQNFGDLKWIFSKKGINLDLDMLRKNVIGSLKKPDGSPIDQLAIVDINKVRRLFPDEVLFQSNYLKKLIDKLDDPTVFNEIFEIVE